MGQASLSLVQKLPEVNLGEAEIDNLTQKRLNKMLKESTLQEWRATGDAAEQVKGGHRKKKGAGKYQPAAGIHEAIFYFCLRPLDLPGETNKI